MKLLICTQAVDLNDPVLGFFHRWIEEFAKHCEQVTVICLSEGAHSLPPNVRVFSLGKEHGPVSRVRYSLRFLRLAWKLRNDYDSVLVHMNPEYFVLAGLWWRLWGKKTALWYTHKSVNIWLRIAALFANHIFTASAESFRLTSSKLSVLGHGIDTARALPRVPRVGNSIRLITIGRIAPAKHVEMLLDAYLQIKKGGAGATLHVIGAPATNSDKVYQEELCSTLAAAGEDPSAIFIGAVPHDELPAYRAEADYFLHASTTGSLDKVVLDAAISGVIPISSSEAYAELFAGYEPLLTYPQGSGKALAERVLALEALPEEKRQELRQVLKERVAERHSLEQLIPRILSLYV